jgi:hypothetical protein
VTSEAVLGANVFRDLFAGLRDIVGGRSAGYERLLRQARETANMASNIQDPAYELPRRPLLRGDLADQRRLAGHPGRHPAWRGCPAAGGGDTVKARLVSCRGRAEPGDLRGAHRVERQGGDHRLRRFCEGWLEEYPRGEGRCLRGVALFAWVGEVERVIEAAARDDGLPTWPMLLQREFPPAQRVTQPRQR